VYAGLLADADEIRPFAGRVGGFFLAAGRAAAVREPGLVFLDFEFEAFEFDPFRSVSQERKMNDKKTAKKK
jgi:hypothetical protein